MYAIRVTKYDPACRNAAGAYTRDEWTSIGDIGHEFGGLVLTEDAYRRTEAAYAEAAMEFLREAGVESLTVVGLENHRREVSPAEGGRLGISQIGEVVRAMLAERFWCRLEDGPSYLHVGHDYYMYLGLPTRCDGAVRFTAKLGLFVEERLSPYLPKEHPF